MGALYVVCGKWILYCLFGGQLVQISNGNLKDFKALNFLDFNKITQVYGYFVFEYEKKIF